MRRRIVEIAAWGVGGAANDDVPLDATGARLDGPELRKTAAPETPDAELWRELHRARMGG